MPVLKLSQYLKLGGIGIGALGSFIIVYAEINVIKEHPIALIIMGVGALVWFAGAWEARHEALLSGAKATTSTNATTTVS